MKLNDFKSKIQMLDENSLNLILNGSALVMIQDLELGLGSSNGAFVIFWIHADKFSSVEDLRDYLRRRGIKIYTDRLFKSI